MTDFMSRCSTIGWQMFRAKLFRHAPLIFGPGWAKPKPMLVSRDAPCRSCGYNLRSLSVGARCAECGTPVAFSLTADLLRFSDPAWLRRILLGLGFVGFGILAAIFPIFVAAIGINRFPSTLPIMLAALVFMGPLAANHTGSERAR
jgi:hypothetical protein